MSILTELSKIKQAESWGSHIPVNAALCSTYNITGVIELGCGNFSTKVFRNYANKVLSIENDASWYDKVRKEFGEDENNKFILHTLGDGIRVHTKRWELTKEKIKEVENYYSNLNTDGYNFLFVDQYASTRRSALDVLHHKFDIIVYHDCQNNNPARPGHTNHSYEMDPDVGTFIPHEDYFMIHDKTMTNGQWTGILIHKNLMQDFNDFLVTHQKMCSEFTNHKPCMDIVYESGPRTNN